MTDRVTSPVRVREMDDVRIPMADGCLLAARIWLPEDAESNPVPAVLEYIPYRKNDGTAARDAARHPVIAAHGYASVRVDIRGSGDSEGLLLGEYLQQELDDACEVIAWLAGQSWCSGHVGMTGISWGGFNALQVAALRPPALKAIISVCSTDDRYAEDVHYMGGCVLGSDMLSWASTMLAYGARPPDPARVGDAWRDLWLERLEVRPFVEDWLTHQRRDDFWRHGSVCEDYDRLDCAVYMVGGWEDAYRDAVLRFLAGYDGPRKGLLGPWGHLYPDEGVPGPAVDFLAESVRFWDHWLKGVPNGIMDEPMLRVFLRERATQRPAKDRRAGRWVTEPRWPSPTVSLRRFALGAGTLDELAPHSERHDVGGAQLAGLEAGAFMGRGAVADLPGDQRGEDGLALCYTSPPLDHPVEVLGRPEVTLEVAADRPNALVAVRLCEVTPTGASLLVSRGLLNLTHRDGSASPSPLEPGRRYVVTVRLNAAGHTLSADNRLRVAISPTYWPWAWPSPEPVVLSVHTGQHSALLLPVREAHADEEAPLAAPAPASGSARIVATSDQARRLVRDLVSDAAHLTAEQESAIALHDGLTLMQTYSDEFSITEGDPLSASARSRRSAALARGEWRVRVETDSTMSADRTHFLVDNTVDAYEDDVLVWNRSWSARIPRDHV